MKLTTLMGLVCLGAAATAQDIRFDYDRSTNFAAFRTYQWIDLPAGRASSQLMDQNIKRAVDAQLALKGLQRVESGGDLQVAYQVGVHQEKQFDAWGPGPRLYGPGRVTTSTIESGKLIIDLVDPAKKQLVWQGAAEKTLDIKKDPDKNFRNLEKAVAKLFKSYPPGSSK
jgi:Domain of unknown function (DUF4136)